MKSLTRAMLTAMAMMALVAPAAAQERPDCGGDTPGACFTDNLSRVDVSHRDDDGDTVVVRVIGSSDDFLRQTPDGSLFAHLQNQDVEMDVYPATGGFLTGTGRISLNWKFSGDGSGGTARCPATHTVSGIVSDGINVFEVTADLVARPGRDGSCVNVLNEVRIVAE
jgi:hypothetical protein